MLNTKFPNYTILIVSSLLIVLCACEEEVPFPDRNATPLLVVNAVFSEGRATTIHLSKTASLSNSNLSVLSDAKLYVEDEKGNTTDFYHEAAGIYKAENFVPLAGSSYTLHAEANDLANVSATTTIPADFSYVLKDTSYGFQEGIPSWFFEIEVMDNIAEDNYLVIDVAYRYEDASILPGESTSESFIPFAHFCFDPNADNTDLLSDTEYSNAGLKAVYLSDQAFAGDSYTINLAVADRNLSKPKEGKTFATLRIRSVSKDLFDYYKSFERYRLNQGNFFAEPVQIFSNIENGTGILGGSNKNGDEIELLRK